MKLLKRLKFAFKYDFDQDFIVMDYKGQMAMRYLRYEDAKTFADEQVQYIPKVMIAIKRQNRV